MIVSQNTETLPVLLKNYVQSREQKWYRASIVSLLTSRKTKLRHLPENQDHKGSLQKRTGTAVPRAENFGDFYFKTADHKFLSEGCDSRHKYPCETKASQETEQSLQQFLEPTRQTQVIYTDNSLEFGKSCEDVSWNHCTSTPHRSDTLGLLREQCAE